MLVKQHLLAIKSHFYQPVSISFPQVTQFCYWNYFLSEWETQYDKKIVVKKGRKQTPLNSKSVKNSFWKFGTDPFPVCHQHLVELRVDIQLKL